MNPNSAQVYRFRADTYRANREYEKAASDFTESIRLDNKAAQTLSNYAWLLATCPKTALRDGKKSLELATTACELSRWTNYRHVTVLAAAYSEVGDFKEAVRWMKKAIELGKSDDEGRAMLRSFESGRPLSAEGGSP
ncbi:MAG: tetratricopeptide repeat protein [Planctomycetaceae bacterium]|nr:tetratricopeptide repeat protein [Planctomycetaceae bacterium]